ncbi:MAG: ATP-binding cassette domain-containing protein, partial [Candidatus Cloacimonadales bacterium]|nr:ATP-binding cassette domain-containing protein [Candidatus Cloacimonadales bacterium]
ENLQIPAEEIQNRINKTLTKLQIEELRYKETHTLSFGQKRLVTFASLLTLDPQVFLLDEITAGLSQAYTDIIKTILQELKAEGKIIFLTDHSREFLKLADQIIRLNFE